RRVIRRDDALYRVARLAAETGHLVDHLPTELEASPLPARPRLDRCLREADGVGGQRQPDARQVRLLALSAAGFLEHDLSPLVHPFVTHVRHVEHGIRAFVHCAHKAVDPLTHRLSSLLIESIYLDSESCSLFGLAACAGAASTSAPGRLAARA